MAIICLTYSYVGT